MEILSRNTTYQIRFNERIVDVTVNQKTKFCRFINAIKNTFKSSQLDEGLQNVRKKELYKLTFQKLDKSTVTLGNIPIFGFSSSPKTGVEYLSGKELNNYRRDIVRDFLSLAPKLMDHFDKYKNYIKPGEDPIIGE